jgi:HSP20 family protein
MVKRWDPFKDIAHLSEMMSRLLDEEIHQQLGAGTSAQSDWIPAVDLIEMEDKFILKADLAGISRKDIIVEVVDNQLILRGERRSKKHGHDEKYFRLELPYGKFYRIFPLPAEVDCSKVHAALTDGVLEVTLAKQEKHSPRKITVKCEVQ